MSPETHNYTNPSEKQDLSHLEASAGGEVDHQGWPKKPPISDRECIYKCLDNSRALAGLDRKQVERLAKQFDPHIDVEVDIESEYPPL